MLVHVPLLALAVAASLAAALAFDVLRPWIIREPGTQSLRWADLVLVNLLFFSLGPGMIYAWVYPLVPFSGWRAGVFMGVGLFLLAVAPTFAVYRLDVTDRTRATFGHLFWVLLKYLVVYALLAGVYQP
jgi:hypothetical protein